MVVFWDFWIFFGFWSFFFEFSTKIDLHTSNFRFMQRHSHACETPVLFLGPLAHKRGVSQLKISEFLAFLFVLCLF